MIDRSSSSKYKLLKQHLEHYDTTVEHIHNDFSHPDGQANNNNKINNHNNNNKQSQSQSQPVNTDDALFYFSSLASLSTDILIQQSDIAQLKNKIEFMRSKYSQMAVKYAQKKRKQEQKRLVHCEHDECRESFQKDKQLHYHKLFAHEDSKLVTNTLFTYNVSDDQSVIQNEDQPNSIANRE